ncbi:hypothetical protein [Allocoleopsis franciscana]|uniref:hypothetical protein n=1 Tax=Allocoleopsis franciscana TaxID=2886352 RepID=UPI0002D94941|nr:hypothetical protein [Allocoleopsis franciscana]
MPNPPNACYLIDIDALRERSRILLSTDCSYQEVTLKTKASPVQGLVKMLLKMQ